MDSRIEKVMENHQKGYNCSQAVACAYCDLFGVDEKEAFRAVECFGRGMGIMGTCGAVSAMAYLVGLKVSDVDLDRPRSKVSSYNTLKPMTQAFVDKNRSLDCKTLKGLDTGVVLRSCTGCIQDAAEIVETYLLKEKSE
ncbi:putative redox-active protein [Anaerotignum neopropionicum]|uniref:Putative redox-active protein n=1 Tax=Anaerotignum neopropionicum TaxID=36847 RepID=A0A136WBK5_9FIRM|nr:C-GCAxxG-C-C family protein [Anaerotignum neopropionicum]KXL51891.1 putative redox-active protein [Anaerotignum neopropionicum]